MTLALLLTAATGAWADIAVGDVFKTGSTIDFGTTSVRYKTYSGSSDNSTLGATGKQTLTYQQYTNGKHWFNISTGSGGQSIYIVSDNTAEPWGIKVSGGEGTMGNPYSFEVLFEAPFFDLPLVSQPGAKPQLWEFEMPGSDVVLTPRYAAATIYQNDGETEKQAYETLKEAIANVQDGDVIKLDWDVTLTENLKTPTIQGGVKFTIDFNGYTLDAGTYLYLANEGDELTLTDNSGLKDPGGFKAIAFSAAANAKYIFDKGRYYFGGGITAEMMNTLFETSPNDLVEGKEFVDLEGGADANDGFTMIIAWKAFELTIGKGRFDTFYANQNVALDAETPAGVGLYTITLIEEDSETGEPTVAYLDKLTGVVEKETPMLVYNGTDAQQTVKIKVTPDDANAENEGISPLENFMGTAVAKTFTEDDMAAADYYALSGGKLFVPVYDAGTIGKNQCWLQFNHANGAPARGITLVFEKEEATEITEVSEVNEAGDDSWYDLSGRKLDGEPTAKGVYVKDGKKVVVK